MSGLHLKLEIPSDEFLNHLTEAAYRVALKKSPKTTFTEFQEDLGVALKEVIQRDMFATDVCGLYTVCQEAVRLEPWSQAAAEAFGG